MSRLVALFTPVGAIPSSLTIICVYSLVSEKLSYYQYDGGNEIRRDRFRNECVEERYRTYNFIPDLPRTTRADSASQLSV